MTATGRGTFKVDDEVRDVLRRSALIQDAKGWGLQLPGQLDRALYLRVVKVIEAAGGKWNRRAAAHLFPEDPCTALGLAVESGVAVDEQAARGAYYTPPAVVERVLTLADVRHHHDVLEPSCGEGALVLPALRLGAAVTAVDTDDRALSRLRAAAHAENQHGRLDARLVDFLTCSVSDLGQYDRVIMNPPFGRGLDAQHVAHALDFLRPGGRLVSVMAAGIDFVMHGPYRQLREKLERGTSMIIEPLPDGAFKVAGTGVATRILVVDRF